MPDGITARDRLERLCHVLPAAMREGGADLEDLAVALETSQERIVEDIEEMTARAYYQPGGWPDDVQVLMEGGRVRVLHAAGFERPAKLSLAETLCLALALRGTAASATLGDQEARRNLLARAEVYLVNGARGDEGQVRIAAADRDPDPEGIRERVIEAARLELPCHLTYLKAGASKPTARVVHPYAVVYAEGRWYLVGYCTLRDDVRVFRVDRILSAAAVDGSFDPPQDFRLHDYVGEGRVYQARQDVEVLVRYSPNIARWLVERWQGDGDMSGEDDGSVVLRHRVADPWWAVSHVLQYGVDARILEPEDVRSLVADVADELGGA